MMAAQMTLSEDLRRAINESGLSINALSKECGVTQPALSRFVRGDRDIKLGSADKLAEYFRLRLMPEEEKPKRKKKPAG